MDLGINSESYSPTELLIRGIYALPKPVTVLSGEGAIAANTLLGKITLGAVTGAAKSGGNTGNGTLTIDATTPKLARAKAGVYSVRCITSAADGGTFRVTDPEGYVLGDVAVGATFSNQIKLVIADGATDFIVGDGFDITIADGAKDSNGNYKYKAYNSANVDGSQYPECILSAAVDATSADVTEAAYFTGYFNEDVVVGLDVNAKTLLRDKGMFFTAIM